uniref:Uncharacterized protein n=1 Tax=Strigamia maritima TaxID=126957 RepID=T1J0J7_STRMM
MVLYSRSMEKRKSLHEFRRHEEEVVGSLCRGKRCLFCNKLQNTIFQLEQGKDEFFWLQNCRLTRLVNQQNHDSDGGIVEAVDEGIGSMSPPGGEESGSEELKKEMLDLRGQLDRERRLRLVLEEQARNMEAQLYPERIREIAQQVHLEYKSHSPIHPELYTESVESEEVVEPVVEMDSQARDREPGVASSPLLDVSRVNSEPKPKLYVASTSRQNLETIVEAIRHLEGDHLFQDDPVPSTTCTARVITEMKSEDLKQMSNTSRRRDTSTESSPFAYRRQVIQVPPVVRPGVIVSTHS